MEIQGKYVILFIFGTALVAASGAWTFQYLRGRRVLDLWSAQNAQLIRVKADHVELLVMTSTATKNDDTNQSTENGGQNQATIDEKALAAALRHDITHSRGLIHARQALIEDASFDWEQARGDCHPCWEYALQFSCQGQTATVLVDTHCQRIRLWETGAEASIQPIFDGLQLFIKEQLEPADDAEPEATGSKLLQQ